MDAYKYIADLTASGAVVITVILFLKFLRANNNGWGLIMKGLSDQHKDEIGRIVEKNSSTIEKVVDRNSTALEDINKTIQYCKKMQDKA